MRGEKGKTVRETQMIQLGGDEGLLSAKKQRFEFFPEEKRSKTDCQKHVFIHLCQSPLC